MAPCQNRLINFLVWRIDEISSVTTREYVFLKAATRTIDNDEFNCAKCLSKFDSRADKDRMLEASRKNKGCSHISHSVLHKVDDIQFRTCIGNFTSNWSFFVIDLYNKYQKGLLPFQGSIAEQPNKIIECFNVLDNWTAEKINEQKKKEALKHGKRANRSRSSR